MNFYLCWGWTAHNPRSPLGKSSTMRMRIQHARAQSGSLVRSPDTKFFARAPCGLVESAGRARKIRSGDETSSLAEHIIYGGRGAPRETELGNDV